MGITWVVWFELIFACFGLFPGASVKRLADFSENMVVVLWKWFPLINEAKLRFLCKTIVCVTLVWCFFWMVFAGCRGYFCRIFFCDFWWMLFFLIYWNASLYCAYSVNNGVMQTFVLLKFVKWRSINNKLDFEPASRI